MSVLIKGMEKPEHCGYCRFRYDGVCHALQKTQYSMNECPLVVIDDAGLNDTISRQSAIDVADYTDYTGLAIEDVKKVTDEVVKGLKQLPSIDTVNHTADYDEKNDILFVHLSPDNSNSYGEEIDKNIIIMRDMDSNEITGVMLYGFNKYVKHGRWIEIQDDVFASTYKCSECGCWPFTEDGKWVLTDYCPHCGSRMDAEGKEE